jgi:preprotein translocase subunit SecY
MLNKLFTIFKIPDLRNKILIVLLILACFRALAAIPIPGVDPVALKSFLGDNQIFGLFNIFSGGALSNLSIAMLGLGPYITSTIIMQLLTMVFPQLKVIYYEEGAIGRAKFNRYSRLLTVPLAAIQGYGFLQLLASQKIITQLGFYDVLSNVIIITAGSMILVWFGDIITEQKIGNGVSLLIFAGIVSRLPVDFAQGIELFNAGQLRIDTLVVFIIMAMVIIAGVVLVNEGERKVPVSYARRVRGNKMYGGVSSYLPLKVNQAGVIPIIFAISVLLFPGFIAKLLSTVDIPWLANGAAWLNAVLSPGTMSYGIIYFFLVFIFTYFYTAVTFDPSEISKNLQRSGGFVPGIRPGEPTAVYLRSIISRVTLFGASFLGIIAVLPILTQSLTKASALTIGGTALLIVVSVVLETTKQIDSQLTVREYEGFR